jgi:alpha-ketoglutaric semialdehyde dehydrogenase
VANRIVPNLVGGQWLEATGAATAQVRDPSDVRRVVAEVPAMTAADVARVFDWAARGAAAWRHTSVLERAAVLATAAALLRDRADEVTRDLVREMGKTRAEAQVEVAKSADFLDYYGSAGRWAWGELLADARPGTDTSVRIEPVGVVVAITPWNDPLLTPARKLGPALVSGNAVVLKPSLDTPVVGIHLARALHDAGLPPGVLGTVTGRVADVGPAVLGDPRVDAVTFTGSTETGRFLRRALADGNARLQTETGGKNASVVLADADLDLATVTVTAAAFGQAGQRCTATSRLILERPVADAMLGRITEQAESSVVGPGDEPGTVVCPLVSPGHRDRVLAHVAAARDEGASILTGGAAPADERLSFGCYVEPTVVADVKPSMAIWRDEVFGPVLAVSVADDYEQALRAVNDSRYGLAAAIFTRSLRRAHDFVDRAAAGQVAVNLPTSGWDVHHPFGGFGESGSPFKEQGASGLRFYTRLKTAAVRYAG